VLGIIIFIQAIIAFFGILKLDESHATKVSPLTKERANNLFRWLNDFGPRFGWRATGTLTKLQEAANLGGLGIIAARRRDDRRPGHIVMVVPETDSNRARRNFDGRSDSSVTKPGGKSQFSIWHLETRLVEGRPLRRKRLLMITATGCETHSGEAMVLAKGAHRRALPNAETPNMSRTGVQRTARPTGTQAESAPDPNVEIRPLAVKRLIHH